MEALDPDFLEELMARIAAEVDVEAARRKAEDRERRRRKRQQQAARAMGAGWAVEDVDVE